MGEIHHALYVVDAVGGFLACAVARRTHIHGVGSGKKRADGCVGIFGRSKEFEYTHNDIKGIQKDKSFRRNKSLFEFKIKNVRFNIQNYKTFVYFETFVLLYL